MFIIDYDLICPMKAGVKVVKQVRAIKVALDNAKYSHTCMENEM